MNINRLWLGDSKTVMWLSNLPAAKPVVAVENRPQDHVGVHRALHEDVGLAFAAHGHGLAAAVLWDRARRSVPCRESGIFSDFGQPWMIFGRSPIKIGCDDPAGEGRRASALEPFFLFGAGQHDRPPSSASAWRHERCPSSERIFFRGASQTSSPAFQRHSAAAGQGANPEGIQGIDEAVDPLFVAGNLEGDGFFAHRDDLGAEDFGRLRERTEFFRAGN